MGLILRTAVLTDLGLRRANNEDAAYAGHRLIAVADGMGGLPAGELASDIAIRSLAALDRPGQAPPANHAGVAGASEVAGTGGGDGAVAVVGAGGAGAAAPEDLVGSLRVAFDQASELIRAAAEEDAVRDGMGTTVTALMFGADQVAVMHIGDSRGYLFRDDRLTQLTKDDTFVQALVDQGVITPEGARGHPQRALVTKAMQGQPVAPFSTTIPVRLGDVFLLCSDGLSDVLPDDMIAAQLRTRGDLEGCAAGLVSAAVAGGGPDNVTVVLAEVVATG